MHLEILSKEQAEIIKDLKFLSDRDFYLAGGTALALQLGHRTSIDFDFYNPNHFDPSKLTLELTQKFPERVKVNQQLEDTLKTTVPLIRPLKDFEGVKLASVEDIAAKFL